MLRISNRETEQECRRSIEKFGMGARSVRERPFGVQLLEGLAVLLLFLGSFVSGQPPWQNGTYNYWPDDQEAIHTICEAWKNSTDMSSNLAGWNSTNTEYCEFLNVHSSGTVATSSPPSWQGVQCNLYCNSDSVENCTARNIYVVGLELSNASIVGVLPPEITNIIYLYSLILTGNPNLTGPLPNKLNISGLNFLDVHDNGFNGTIPLFPYSWNLLKLNLGGNRFIGSYPFEQFYVMAGLQELSIGGNLFNGPIPDDAFTNKTELNILDISDNFFNGTLPNLNPLHHLTHLVVAGNAFEGMLPNLTSLKTLHYVDLGRNRFTGTSNLADIFNLSASTELAYVDLSHNLLTGPLPSWTNSSLGSVANLYLDDNNFTGTLDISSMSQLKLLQEKDTHFGGPGKLTVMSLSNNNIQHVISNPNIIANSTTVFILQGNPYCHNFDSNDDTQRCYCSQVCYLSSPTTNDGRIIVISATNSVAAMVFILLIIGGAILIKNRRYKQYLQLQFEKKFEEFDVKPTIFSYNELRGATREFCDDMKLGQGAYGAVYKGVLPSGNLVAVKQLFMKTAQSHAEFLNEVVLITGMKHRNLVNLKGCCLRESQKLLVYEYVENFDLDQILFGSKKQEMSSQLSSWPSRIKICLGIARGLHYLHELAHPRVIHRDIKAANILLNTNLEPKIADFGLALLFPDDESHIMTMHVAGTKGYLAPEYASLGQLSDKVDVYSFGVLCLEIISGRRNIDNTAPLEQVYLSQWAWQLHRDEHLIDLVDSALHLSEDEVRDVHRVLHLCMLCIDYSDNQRPSMAHIVSIFQRDTECELQVRGEDRPSSAWSQWSKKELGRVLEEKEGSFSNYQGKVRREGERSLGRDTLGGSHGRKTLGGSHGRKTLGGSHGHKTLGGSRGSDTLEGSLGHDTLGGSHGRNNVGGNRGSDTLGGSLGRDTLGGSHGRDTLGGSHEHNTLGGSLGHDTLGGSLGHDTLGGSLGHDTLGGSHGHNTLGGSRGSDTLGGNRESDTFLEEIREIQAR